MKQDNPINILIVDDRAMNLTALEAVLDSPEYNLVKAVSGPEAIGIAGEMDFAAILLDVQMPRMDGFETATRIRALENAKTTPIIFLTAIYGDESYIERGYSSGAVDYIFKPLNPTILKAKVGVFVELYKQNIQIQRQAELLRESERRQRQEEISRLQLQSLRREMGQQTRYRDLVESFQDCIVWVADPENLAFSFVSPLAKKLTGFAPNEWLDDPHFWIKHVHPEDLDNVLSELKNVNGNQEITLKHRFLKSDGSYLWFQTGLKLVQYTEGKEFDLRGISIDITAIKQSEEAQRFLAESGSLLAGSLDYEVTLAKVANLAVPRLATWCAVQLQNDDGSVETVAATHTDKGKTNSVYELCTEHSCGRIVAKVIESGMPEFSPQTFEQELAACASDAKQLILLQDVGLKSLVCVPLVARGRPLGAITFVSTERIFSQADLNVFEELGRRAGLAVENSILYKNARDAIRMRDEFISLASHELKTPLTPIKLQLETLSRYAATEGFKDLPTKIKTVVLKSNRQIDRITTLIDDLLNVSRINLGRASLELRRTSLGQLVQETTEQFKEEFTKANCELIVDVKGLVEGFWDRAKIEQILVNLLTNAVKYGSGTPVKVSCFEDDGKAVLSIQDKGIGIAEKDQNRIFDLFERAVSNRNYGGLGLGLYIVRRFVEAHGGTISVSSSPGTGSLFVVELPLNPVSSVPQHLPLVYGKPT